MSDSDTTDTMTVITESLVFRYGVDMSPEQILAETPGARFVARARLVPDWASASPACSTLAANGPADLARELDGDVWGILLIQPEEPEASCAADVITDAGHRTHATVLTAPAALSDREAMIAQARYWELSPAYIRRLGLLVG